MKRNLQGCTIRTRREDKITKRVRLSPEERKRRLSEARKGKPKSESWKKSQSAVRKGVPKSEAWKKAHSLACKTKPFSEEWRQHRSENMADERHFNWQGGCSDYFHDKAHQLFGSPVCQGCGISQEEYKRNHKYQLDMHCVSGDYTILEQWNWRNLCAKCHRGIHKKKETL